MDKNEVITISDWNEGQSKFPLQGFGLLQNVEVFENKGIVKMSPVLTQSSLTATQLPIAYVKDTYGNYYHATGVTGTGTIYKNNTSIQSSLTNVFDMVIYKNYLWVRHSTVMSCYGPLNNSPQWFGNVGTGFTESYWGKMIIGQDDIAYICNGNLIASFTVSTSGTPGVAPTISLNLSALDLPEGQFASTIIEYGSKLLIGASGGANYSDSSNFNNARLYPWDRVSASVTLPVIFNENGIQALIQNANRVYVIAGNQGNVYETDSTNYRKIATIPYIQEGVSSFINVYPNAIAISPKGTLLIGASVGSNYGNSGIYEIDINDPKYPIAFKYILSPGITNSSSGRVSVGFIYPSTYQDLTVGWQNVSSYGIDSSSFYLASNYQSVIESPLIQVGSKLNKKTFQNIEWSLAKPLVSSTSGNGQAIRISYRKDNSSSYTLIGTWDYSTVGNVVSFVDKASISDAEYLQIKVELSQPQTTVYGNNIYLRYVRIW